MANTETIPTSHTNGVIEDGYDEDDKSKMRPADIDADMREMERRKRVELIMNSRLFREELERIIESQMRDGNNSAGLLQQIYDMVGSKYGTNNHILKNSSCVAPINDIRGVEAMGYAKGEKILRCKLAALFRLIELYGWSQNIYNHITARLSQQEEHFLVNPYGLLYNEITASSLVKVDMQGNVIESGTTNFAVNAGGFQLHAAIYAARPDLKCIVHLHTPSVLAVSSLKDGLLPLCQEAAVIGDISHHAYVGVPSGPEERDKLVRNLGPNNKVIFLTNHGALCCGETIEETFFYVYNTVSACETQLKVMPFGKDNLILLSDETRKVMYDAARKMPENITPNPNIPAAAAVAEKRWRVGGLEFEALMRMLDNAGFRTGYVYRQPLIKGEVPRPRNDVEVPPAVSSLGYLLEEEELYRQGVWRKQNAKGSDRIRWLNSPNVYQKVEILETGTTDPKKITKWVDANNEEWVADGSPSHTSTPVKIENALQFVPKNTNPKEFKKLQQQIKDNRRADKITSGPQSHILEGVSWEEAKKLQDANAAGNSDQVILVGAASKGIIQREFQHNATVYKTPYAKNPFDAVTDEEIEKYKKDITRKQKGDSYYDEDESDALSSSLPPSGKNITGVTSETEDDSLTHEMRVIQIHTSTAPKASQAEVVLSDDGKKSKNKFVHSLGSMLTLRRDNSRRTHLSVLYTRMWEQPKLSPATVFLALAQLATYPTAWQDPIRIRIDENGAEEVCKPLEMSLLMKTYLEQASGGSSYAKQMCQLVASELRQRFCSGKVFGRRRQLTCGNAAAFSAYDLGSASRLVDRRCYSGPAPISIDSSEMEYTTLIEVPRPLRSQYASESPPHDFSSTGTTEDEEEEETPSGADNLAPLEHASSLKSITSCLGTEYEEQEVRPLQLESQTHAEVTELTSSFTTAVSDDTSVDDVTVIYQAVETPVGLLDVEDVESHFSDGSQSIGSFSLSSIDEDEQQLSDSNTYSCLADVDFEDYLPDAMALDAVPAAPEECSTSFIGKDPKFKMELSVIYEEHGNVSADSAEAAVFGGERCEVDAPNADLTKQEPKDPEDAGFLLDPKSSSALPCLPVEYEAAALELKVASGLPSVEAISSTFAPTIQSDFDAVTSADNSPSIPEDYSVNESFSDSAVGNLTFVTDAAGSAVYSVPAAIRKFRLFSAHVLNLVNTMESRYAGSDSSPSNGSKLTLPSSNNNPSSDTHSSAALVQQNSNSEAHTISDTSLVSCIADNEDTAAVKLAPTLEECDNPCPSDLEFPVEDIETNTSSSEIFEDETADQKNDDSYEELVPNIDCSQEIIVPLTADTSGFSISGDEELPLDSFSSSISEEKLENYGVDASVVASYYKICPEVIDYGPTDDLPIGEVAFGQSFDPSGTEFDEIVDSDADILNMNTSQTSHWEDSSGFIADSFPDPTMEEFMDESHCSVEGSLDPNLTDTREMEYTYPSYHSSCGGSDVAQDSSDYYDTVEDTPPFQFSARNEEIAENTDPEEEDPVQESNDYCVVTEGNTQPAYTSTADGYGLIPTGSNATSNDNGDLEPAIHVEMPRWDDGFDEPSDVVESVVTFSGDTAFSYDTDGEVAENEEAISALENLDSAASGSADLEPAIHVEMPRWDDGFDEPSDVVESVATFSGDTAFGYDTDGKVAENEEAISALENLDSGASGSADAADLEPVINRDLEPAIHKEMPRWDDGFDESCEVLKSVVTFSGDADEVAEQFNEWILASENLDSGVSGPSDTACDREQPTQEETDDFDTAEDGISEQTTPSDIYCQNAGDVGPNEPLVVEELNAESYETDIRPVESAKAVAETQIPDRVSSEESTGSLKIDPVTPFGVSDNPSIAARRLQANADVVCLSFENLNYTDIVNTRCASTVEPTEEINKEPLDPEEDAAESTDTFDWESAVENIVWLFNTDISDVDSLELEVEDDLTELDAGSDNLNSDSLNKEEGGADALQPPVSLGNAAKDEPVSLSFHSDTSHANISDTDILVGAELAADIADALSLADCFDWMFGTDGVTSSNSLENNADGGDGSGLDSSHNSSEDETQKEYHELPTSDMQCVTEDLVTAQEMAGVVGNMPESCEVVGRLIYDTANCSITSNDDKIEYDLNQNQITTDGHTASVEPKQQTSETYATSAPPPSKKAKHRRSSSSSSSTDTVHIGGNGRNSATWCQSGGESMGELSLKLRLKVEWDNRPAASKPARSSSSSGADSGGAKQSSFEEDSLDSGTPTKARPTGAEAGTKETPNGRMPRSKLLIEFKNNYPKFIQYSYFSPKVRRRSPRQSPQTAPAARVRKCNTAAGGSPLRNACQSADSARIREPSCRTQLGAVGGGEYMRFGNISSAQWPSFGQLAKAELTSRSSSLLLDSTNMEALSFKTSTPKGQQPNEFGSQCISSLEEFEILESMLEVDKEAATR